MALKSCLTFFILSLAFSLGLQAGLASRSAAAGQSRKDKLAAYADDLKNGMEYKRILVLQALGRKKTPEAYGLIIQTMLHDKSKPVRRAAQRELNQVQDPGIYPAITQALKDPERTVRLAAIDALALARDPQAADALLSAAQAGIQDNELVLTAMEALRNLVCREEPLPGFEKSLHPFLEYPDSYVRRTVVAILGILSRPDSLPDLIALWGKADNKTRILITDAFANLGRVEPVNLLLGAIEDGSKDLKIHAVYALAQIQSFYSLGAIRQLLEKNTDTRVRMACLYALTEIPDEESIPVVSKMLETDDATVIHWAAYALGELHAVQTIPKLAAQLKDRNPLVRASLVTALAELDARQKEKNILELIQDSKEEKSVKIAAAKALMKWGNPQGAEIIWPLIRESGLDLETRMVYALALGASKPKKYQELLAGELKSPDFEKAFVAAIILGAMGDARVKPLLLKALDHGYPSIRRYAILALEGLPDKEVFTALANTAADDPDPLVTILCASSLVAAGFKDFRVILWNALDNQDEDLRSEAVVALGRSADGQTLKQLKWYQRRESAIPVRQTIQRIIRQHHKF